MAVEMLTIEEAAKVLDCRDAEVRLLVRQGVLEAWMHQADGGQLLVRRSAVEGLWRAGYPEPTHVRMHLICSIVPGQPMGLYCGFWEDQLERVGKPHDFIDPTDTEYINLAELEVLSLPAIKARFCIPCLLAYLQDSGGQRR